MNPNGLMIGNGLNRMVNNTAWTDLLKNLQAKYTLDALDLSLQICSIAALLLGNLYP